MIRAGAMTNTDRYSRDEVREVGTDSIAALLSPDVIPPSSVGGTWENKAQNQSVRNVDIREKATPERREGFSCVFANCSANRIEHSVQQSHMGSSKDETADRQPQRRWMHEQIS